MQERNHHNFVLQLAEDLSRTSCYWPMKVHLKFLSHRQDKTASEKSFFTNHDFLARKALLLVLNVRLSTINLYYNLYSQDFLLVFLFTLLP